MSGTLLKRLMKDKKEDIAHTSAFADVQNKGRFGVSSSLSFEERMAIEKKRKLIKKYDESKVAHSTEEEIWRLKQNKRRVSEKKGNNTTNDNSVSGDDDASVGRASGVGRDSGGTDVIGNATKRAMMSKPPMRRNPGISR